MLMFAPFAATADPFQAMSGKWSGSGWARKTTDGPQEATRCRLTNSYSATALELRFKGKCVAAGEKLTLSGKVTRNPADASIQGLWSNPDGLGQVKITGRHGADFILFTYRAKDPDTGQPIAQNVEWRIVDGQLQLRSVDRDQPNILMSEIFFDQ